MWLTGRKTTPRVRDGRVQRKNNHGWTPARELPFIVREEPPRGFRHLLTVADVEAFVELLPSELLDGVEHVVLSDDVSCLGWCRRGVVAVSAWPRELWAWLPPDWLDEHWASLKRYGVSMVMERGRVRCELSASQVRAFQLLRVLTHELGHHADLMATRSKTCAFGESFAERFALRWEEQLWAAYVDRFGWPDPR